MMPDKEKYEFKYALLSILRDHSLTDDEKKNKLYDTIMKW